MKFRSSLFAVLFMLAAWASAASAQTRVITGTVKDQLTGQPLGGAQVVVPNTTIRTTVREDGTFSLGVPIGQVSVLVRMIGYQRALIAVSGTQRSLDVMLTEDVLRLDEVVVTGQATGVERRNLAHGITTISADELDDVPAASIEQLLQGKIPGANIQSNSGAPGGGVQVELRGVTSFVGRSPLYVIDGIILSDVAIPSNINEITRASTGSNSSLTQDNQVNRITDLNPADIETIEVLKGASASAIYGSKASNGVIIITTKRGRVGRPQINVSQRFGFFDLANTIFREFDTAADVDAVFGAGTAAANNFEPGRNVEEILSGRNHLSYESNISISGGNENTRYFISGLWKDDEGVMQNTGFEKQGLRVNIDQDISDRVRLSVSTNLIHTLAQRGISNNDNSGTSPIFALAFTPVFADLERRADGTFPDNPFERSNPLQTTALMSNDEEVWRVIGSGRLEIDAIQSDRHSVQLIGIAGFDRFSQENALLFPPELQFEDDDGLPGTSLLSNSNNENINLSGNVVWGFTPASGNLTFTTSGGIQFETRDLNTSRITTRNLIPGQTNINQGSNVQVVEGRARIEDLGLYLQEEVLINDRLLLTAGFRADQSSANTKTEHLFVYPKGSASYRFDFGDGILQGIKFRTAYGESGNQPFFGQKFSALEGRVNIESILGFQIPVGGTIASIATTEIKPERQKEIEAGFDATLFNGRASLEFTGYHRSVSDLLLPRQLAPSSGFTQEIFNGGAMRVNGAEFALAVVPFQTPDFSWVFRSTFGLNRSKITELPVPAFLAPNSGFGADLGQFFIEEGESATQIVGNVPQASGGSIIDKVGDSNPDFKMGFTNDIKFHGFNLFSLWDYQQGGDIVNLTLLLSDFGATSKDCTDGGATDPCTIRTSNFGTDLGSTYIEPATFIKLRELTLSWNVPQNIVGGIWGAARSARLTISGRNLITITDYSGQDPEVSNFGNQAIGRNIDVAPFPRTRSFWFGIDVGF